MPQNVSTDTMKHNGCRNLADCNTLKSKELTCKEVTIMAKNVLY
jgi:hypothetical protein